MKETRHQNEGRSKVGERKEAIGGDGKMKRKGAGQQQTEMEDEHEYKEVTEQELGWMFEEE
jgi:hypothetical protein